MRTVRSAGGLVAIGLAIASIALVPRPSEDNAPTHLARARSETSGCTVAVTRSLAPDAIRTCETCVAELLVRPYCPSEPLNVVLVLSGYAAFSTEYAKRWTEAAIEALAMPRNPHVRAGVVYVRRTATIRSELTNVEGDVSRASRIEFVNPGSLTGDWPCYSCGFEQAVRVLGDTDPRNNVIVYIGYMINWPMVEHDDDSYFRDFQRGARKAKTAAKTLIIGCPWPLDCRDGSDFPWYREASSGYFFTSAGPGRFANAIQDLVPGPSAVAINSLVVDEAVPLSLEYLMGSASPAPTDFNPTTGRLRWSIAAPITAGLPITLSYRVKPRDGITTPVTASFTEGLVAFTDTVSVATVLTAPSTALTVTGECAPPASPTPAPTESPTPTETSVPPPPTPTRTVVPTATPPPSPVYLPIALREIPCTRRQPADVVLVIDASSSMDEPAGDGRTKLAAARSAALEFVERLKLDAGDQAAIVSFNRDARIALGLSADRSALEGALRGIATASETCLVCGLELAGEAFADEARVPANMPVVILLTDGRSNPRPVDEAVAEAARLKSEGAVIFTIGLGSDLDGAALAEIASTPAFAFRASDGTALEAIYREIAVTLPGPADCYWGRRP
jgi:hypothetical protein